MAVMFVVGSAKRELQVAWDRAMQSARVDEERAELNRLKAVQDVIKLNLLMVQKCGYGMVSITPSTQQAHRQDRSW